MKNLKRRIKESKFKTQIEFARVLFPDITDKQQLKNKIGLLTKRDFSIIHKCQVLLNCSYNELMSDERTTD